MAEARLEATAAGPALIVATLCEIHRDPKKRRKPFTADQFNPYARKRLGDRPQPSYTKVSIEEFAGIFVRRQLPQRIAPKQLPKKKEGTP